MFIVWVSSADLYRRRGGSVLHTIRTLSQKCTQLLISLARPGPPGLRILWLSLSAARVNQSSSGLLCVASGGQITGQTDDRWDYRVNGKVMEAACLLSYQLLITVCLRWSSNDVLCICCKALTKFYRRSTETWWGYCHKSTFPLSSYYKLSTLCTSAGPVLRLVDSTWFYNNSVQSM